MTKCELCGKRVEKKQMGIYEVPCDAKTIRVLLAAGIPQDRLIDICFFCERKLVTALAEKWKHAWEAGNG